MSKGVVLLALGHQYFGKMAAALAASIKVCGGIPITLFHAGNAILDLSGDERNLFDLVELQAKDYVLNGEYRYLRPKLLLYDLSPYDETLYLDVDMAWLNMPVMQLFDECKSDFEMKNYGFTKLKDSPNDNKAWCSYSDIALIYKLSEQKNYHLSSEAIYFKKTKEVKKLFRAALKVFDNPKIEYRQFAGYMADEMAFQVAMMQTEVYPTLDNWQPVYWRQSNKARCVISALSPDFYALSMGGVRATETEQSIYNIMVQSAYQKLSISRPHKWVNKNRFLNERKQW